MRFRYTGQQLIGQLGLYHYKARFYSPTLGRFLQTDPIGYADDLNLYAYVGNSPVNFVDPSGLSTADSAMLSGTLGGSTSLPSLGSIGLLSTEAMVAFDQPGGVPGPQRIAVNLFPGCTPDGLGATCGGGAGGSIGGPAGGFSAGVSGRAVRGGESPAAADGRRAHGNYGTALGQEYDTRVRLPSGKRPDAVNWEQREVRELKPDNPRAVRRGEKQVDSYRQELEDMTGQAWKSAVDVYQPKVPR